MAWIESHEHLEKNGRLLSMADELQINIYQAIGHMHAFWWWATHNTGREGDLSKYSPITISRASGWDRYIHERIMDHNRGPNEYPNSYAFCHALVTVGFIDIDHELPIEEYELLGDVAKIHQWEKYSKRYFDWHESIENRRESERLRQRSRRENVRKMSRSDGRDSTRPNLTKPNLTKPILTTTTRFTKPTVEEIDEYSKSIGFNLEAEKFFDYYESKGWVVGKTPMKNWKASVRTWKNNKKGFAYDAPKDFGFATAQPNKYPD